MNEKTKNYFMFWTLWAIIIGSFTYWLMSSNTINNTPKTETSNNVPKTENLNNTPMKKYVWFVSTTCPHCRDEMPILDKFYKDYSDKVTMQMIVVDGKKFPWNYSIPQDTTNPITYQDATKEECGYVPSYVIYDEKSNIIDKKCWWALTYEELKQKLLLPETQINNNLETNKKQDMKNIEVNQIAWLQNGELVVVMTTTNWKMTIKLFPELAPKTVLNFLALSQKWYYDGIVFHRVIKNFMIQWGDPTATWMWWESIFGKSFEDEFSPLKNIRWSISMANSWPNTNGSQFFINQVDNNYLDGKHTVFGQVVEWLDNLDKIASVKVWAQDKPEKEVKIIKMEVLKYENNKLSPYKYEYEVELKKIEEEKAKKQEANKAREVKSGDKIKVNYTLTLTDTKEKLDSSYDRWQTLDFTVWSGMMIPWFDNWVIWMKILDKKTINLEAKDAYGEYDEKNIQEIPKKDLAQFEEAWIKLEKWTKLPTQYWEFTIKDVVWENVIVDVNHALAWKKLTFDIEMVWFDD